jgi:hypothetical protein
MNNYWMTNKAMQPTAGRSVVLLNITSTLLLHFTLVLASGG